MMRLASLLTLCVMISLPQALAHAHLIKSVPAPASEGPSPHELLLTFTEPLEPTLVKVAVTSGFNSAGAGPAEVIESGKVLRVPLPALGPATYTVQWDVVSKDGHRTKGTFEFRVK
jgi:methionine-rich copper-binding protein CopC